MKQLLACLISQQSARRAALVCAGLLLALLGLTSPARAQEIRYLYDDLSRLVGVVDQQGNAAEYVYDAVGNLLQIKRFTVDPTATLAISLVSPSRGSVGTQVQIFGKGFSATLRDNQVGFNGTAATVTAATATSLTTTVPAGATTGPLTVAVASTTATAPEPFTVLQGFAVVPPEATVFLGRSYSFQATLEGTPITEVSWRVNGIVGGTIQLGTISPTGLYTAPTTLPPVSGVTVEAVLTADPTRVATAPVALFPLGTGGSAAARLSVGPTPVPASPGPLAAPALSVGLSPPPLTANPLPADALSVSPLPVLTAVSPGSGSRGTSVGVTLTGAGLQDATALTVLRNGSADSLVTVSDLTAAPDGTSLTATLTIDPTAPVGGRILQVTAGGQQSTPLGTGRNSFTVQ